MTGADGVPFDITIHATPGPGCDLWQARLERGGRVFRLRRAWLRRSDVERIVEWTTRGLSDPGCISLDLTAEWRVGGVE